MRLQGYRFYKFTAKLKFPTRFTRLWNTTCFTAQTEFVITTQIADTKSYKQFKMHTSRWYDTPPATPDDEIKDMNLLDRFSSISLLWPNYLHPLKKKFQQLSCLPSSLTMSEPTANSPARAQEITWYQYGFWDRRMRADRQKLMPVLILPLTSLTLLMWACLSLYWGSLLTNNIVTKTRVDIVNLDTGDLGTQIVTGIQTAKLAASNQLDWRFNDASLSVEDCKELVLSESTWAVVRCTFTSLYFDECSNWQYNPVSANAISSLENALSTGDSSYKPDPVMTIFYTSARNQITVNSRVVPSILAVVNPLLISAGINHTSKFLQSASNDQGRLQKAFQCPQCLAFPFAAASVDLIPFDSAVATGSVTVGLIFVRDL